MTNRSCLLASLLLFAGASFAQQDALSVGVSGNYAPTAGAGVGASLDYRHQLGTQLDFTGQVSSLFFTGIGQRTEYADHLAFRNPVYSFAGAGLSYRAQPHSVGFRFGLMPGLVHAPFMDHLAQERYGLAPGALLSIGYQFNERLALAVENMVYLSPATSMGPGRFRQVPTLRLKVHAGNS